MRLSSKMTTMMAYLTKTANYCGTANVRKLSRLDYSLITAKEEEIHIDWYLPAEKVIEIGHRQICLQKNTCWPTQVIVTETRCVNVVSGLAK